MTTPEAAWLAGLFDGEGSLSSAMAGRRRQYKSWLLSLPNTHLPTIERCVELTGVGRIQAKPIPKLGKKPQWAWCVTRQREIASICQQLRPYLITKAERVGCFLDEWVDL